MFAGVIIHDVEVFVCVDKIGVSLSCVLRVTLLCKLELQVCDKIFISCENWAFIIEEDCIAISIYIAFRQLNGLTSS